MVVRRNTREHRRYVTDCLISMTWTDPPDGTRSVRARARDFSAGGIRVESPEAVPLDTAVFVESQEIGVSGSARVCHCAKRGGVFVVGLEFGEQTKATVCLPTDTFADHYEVLQISPNADPDTIRRVYRIMAARFHPDNPQTGDASRFLLMTEAFQILSNPDKRAEYDEQYRAREAKPLPIFQSRDFVDDVAGETNRRLGVLCILYNQRKTCPERPGVSLLQLERLMAFPREYLTFTMWYLREKQYVLMGDDSDYILTALGADCLEAGAPSNQIVHKLLRSPASVNEPSVAMLQ